ncbi:MAG: heme-binding domain-containing protein [Acidobacteria bacterium]|nr:heme-binding domain-containing protein [Acidobacteriota bacterium]
MKKILRYVLLTLGVALVAVQFFPVERSNPPVEQDLGAPPEVDAILRRSCYDCHSNETVWPWYSKIAPVSWLVVHDVEEGREEMNFSIWNRYSAKRRAKKVEEIWEEVEEDEMPLRLYTLAHPRTRLSSEEKLLLESWTKTAEKGLASDLQESSNVGMAHEGEDDSDSGHRRGPDH